VEESSAQGIEGLSRRGLLRGGVLVGLGAVGLTAASSSLVPGVARATNSSSLANNNGAYVSFTYQTDWRYCNGCAMLYYGGRHGICLANIYGPHTPGSSTIYGVPDQVPTPDDSSGGAPVQEPWYICAACACLYWGPGVKGSFCADSESQVQWNHDPTGSGVYYMMNGTWSQATNGAEIQGGWRYCLGCESLYWPQSVSSCMYAFVTKGFDSDAPANYYNHLTGGTDYHVFMNV
jgi:hypothetical protein